MNKYLVFFNNIAKRSIYNVNTTDPSTEPWWTKWLLYVNKTPNLHESIGVYDIDWQIQTSVVHFL